MPAALLVTLALLTSTQQPVKPKGPPSPPAPVVPPDKALDTFTIAPGFKLELVAAEPLVEDPVAMVFDPDGRLWVVEMRGFMPNMEGKGEENPVGQVAVLEDTDGDGKMNKRTVFLKDLVLPRAIALVDGGVLVGEVPRLWYCRDTNGDLRCDKKEIVDDKFCARGNPEHTTNGLLWALDNWMYNAKSSKRYRYAHGKWIKGTTRARGQWGISQDDLGRLFYNSNSRTLQGDLLPVWSPHAHFGKARGLGVAIGSNAVWPIRVTQGVNRGYKNLNDQGKIRSVTAACGPVIFRGDALGKDVYGNAFVCEPSANLVKRVILTEKDGKISGKLAYENAEFLASTDERFRPVNAYTGPDGCLYIVDLYRGILQHRKFLTPYLKDQIRQRGLDKPVGLGRIYRVVGTRKKPGPRPHLSKASSADLVKALSHPNGWWRDTAQRLLVERRDPKSLAPLKTLALAGKVTLGRIHALFTLHGIGQLDPNTLKLVLIDRDPLVKQIAHGIRDLDASTPLDGLAIISASNPNLSDKDLKPADGKELLLLERIMAREEWTDEKKGRDTLLARLAERVGKTRKAADLDRLIYLVSVQPRACTWRQAALLGGLARAKPKAKIETPALAKLSRSSDKDVRTAAETLAKAIDWPGKGTKPVPPPAKPLTREEQIRFDRGRKLFVGYCAACHQASGLGQEGKAPPLVDSEWLLGPEARVVRIVINGLRGPVTVGDRTYEGIDMPGLFTLRDQEISDILSYARREWGHDAPPVEKATVTRIRDATEEREDLWTAAELLKIR